MKATLVLIAAATVALFSGCATATQKNAGAFLGKVASLDITAADVHQSTTTPLYSHSESLSGLSKTADGKFSVTNLKADFTIPLWGVKWDFSASAITANTPQAAAGVATVASGK
jgi:hypothetical protein